MTETFKTPPPSPPPMRTWIKLLLGVSLALNLAVIGLVAGAMLRFGGADGMHAPPRSLGASLYRELPPKARRALRDDLAPGPDGGLPDHAAQTRRLTEVLRSEPFDPDAAAATLTAHSAAQAERLTRMQDAWLVRVTAMSAAERAAYADRLEEALTRRHGHGRSHRDRPPRDAR